VDTPQTAAVLLAVFARAALVGDAARAREPSLDALVALLVSRPRARPLPRAERARAAAARKHSRAQRAGQVRRCCRLRYQTGRGRKRKRSPLR
jgi:hypothetical protein